jgi:hypothetical protein
MDDQAQLRLLADTYARTMDDRDAETLNRLFVPDGRLVITARGRSQEFAAGEGLDKVIGYMAGYDQTFYFVGNHICEVDGDDARCETYTVAYHHEVTDDGRRVIENPVRYLDRCVRKTGGWRFAERKATILWTMIRRLDD